MPLLSSSLAPAGRGLLERESSSSSIMKDTGLSSTLGMAAGMAWGGAVSGLACGCVVGGMEGGVLLLVSVWAGRCG